MESRTVFSIVGTDTEVGKTCAAAGLSRALVELGFNTIAVKPVETGCSLGSSLDQDGSRLAQATGQTQPRAALLRFRQPLAAPLAAERDEQSIDFESLLDATQDALAPAQVGVVEGAGGLLSPITWSETMVELTRALSGRAILVGADRLGTLNHIRLALRVLEAEEIPVAAVILSQVSPHNERTHLPLGHRTGAPQDMSAGSNLSSLRRIPDMPPVMYLPFVEDVEEAADALRPLARELMGLTRDVDGLD